MDLGAGELQFGSLFKRFRYIGVDFQQFPGVEVIADLTKRLPFGDHTADIVTLSNTLEHIPNTEHLLQECARVLKPGGLILGTIPFLLPVHQAPYDFNRYTNFQLTKFLQDAGFHNVIVEPLGEQLDVYNTIELKTFDELWKSRGGLLLRAIRLWRRLEMRLILTLFHVPASDKVCEGYGFAGYTRQSIGK